MSIPDHECALLEYELGDFVTKDKKRKKRNKNQPSRLQLLRNTFKKFRNRLREEVIQNKLAMLNVSIQQIEEAECVTSTRDVQICREESDASLKELSEYIDTLGEWEIVVRDDEMTSLVPKLPLFRAFWTAVN